MSKFLTSILLIAAMLVSGLSTLLQPVNVSAVLNNPIDCNILGFYKDGTKTGRLCLACPIDFYCRGDLSRNDVTGQQIRRSPELPGLDGNQNSEVIPCPAGTTTRGFTTHPSKGTLLTTDQDGFQVGTIATNASQCHAPDFKCPTETPRLVQDLAGEQKCYANCPAGEAAILYEGVQTCGVKCRDDQITQNKKCYKQCPAGEILKGDLRIEPRCVSLCYTSSIAGQVFSADGVCVCPAGTSPIFDTPTSSTGKCGVPVPCPIKGQVKTADNQCICPSPTLLNAAGEACEVPPVACDANTYGIAKPNCTPCPANTSAPAGSTKDTDCKPNPCTISGQIRVNGTCVCPTPSVLNQAGTACETPAEPCPANYFGIKQPNCLPCPTGFTAEAGKALEKKDCKSNPCPVTGQLRYFDGNCFCPREVGYLIIATDGAKSCGKCPANTTQTQGGVEDTGEVQFKCEPIAPVAPPREEGTCEGFLKAFACGALIAGGVTLLGCAFKAFGLCDNQTPIEEPTVTTPTPRDQPLPQYFRYSIVPVDITSCKKSNAEYAQDLEELRVTRNALAEKNPLHQHEKDNYVWVDTITKGSGRNMKTVSFKSATLKGDSAPNESLKCLVSKFAKATDTQYGSQAYIDALRKNGVLHGLNKKFKAECYNISKLVSYLDNFVGPIQPVNAQRKYLLKKGNQTLGSFKTSEEAEAFYNKLKAEYKGTAINQATATYEVDGVQQKAGSNVVGVDVFDKDRGTISNQVEATYEVDGTQQKANSNNVGVRTYDETVQNNQQTNTVRGNGQTNKKTVEREYCLFNPQNYTYDEDGDCIETKIGFLNAIFSSPKVSATESDEVDGDPYATNTGTEAPEDVQPDFPIATYLDGGQEVEVVAEAIELPDFESEGGQAPGTTNVAYDANSLAATFNVASYFNNNGDSVTAKCDDTIPGDCTSSLNDSLKFGLANGSFNVSCDTTTNCASPTSIDDTYIQNLLNGSGDSSTLGLSNPTDGTLQVSTEFGNDFFNGFSGFNTAFNSGDGSYTPPADDSTKNVDYKFDTNNQFGGDLYTSPTDTASNGDWKSYTGSNGGDLYTQPNGTTNIASNYPDLNLGTDEKSEFKVDTNGDPDFKDFKF
jgi:hypothetical protein